MAITANSFITPQKPVFFSAIAVTADVAWQAPVNMVTLIDETVGGNNDNGLRLRRIIAITRATITTNPINCSLYKKVGSVYTLIDSTMIAAVTPSASVANGKADFGYSDDDPLELAAGIGLAFAIGTSTANGIVCHARGGAY